MMRPIYYAGFITILIYGVYFHIYGGDIAFQSYNPGASAEEIITPSEELSQRVRDMSAPKEITKPAAEHGIYTDYTPDKVASYASQGKIVVLFFIAYWCPSCASADKVFTQNIDRIPSDIVILKINYDDAKDLKKKYSVSSQHTYVQVDASGSEILRWNGGSLATLKAMVY